VELFQEIFDQARKNRSILLICDLFAKLAPPFLVRTQHADLKGDKAKYSQANFMPVRQYMPPPQLLPLGF
jgi:hypothetical protein